MAAAISEPATGCGALHELCSATSDYLDTLSFLHTGQVFEYLRMDPTPVSKTAMFVAPEVHRLHLRSVDVRERTAVAVHQSTGDPWTLRYCTDSCWRREWPGDEDKGWRRERYSRLCLPCASPPSRPRVGAPVCQPYYADVRGRPDAPTGVHDGPDPLPADDGDAVNTVGADEEA